MDQSVPRFEDCTPIEAVPKFEECTPIEDDYPKFYGPKREDWNKLRAAFRGDPLAVVPQNMRFEFEFATNRMENPDQERKKIALSAYFSRIQRERFDFVYGNLNSVLKTYYGYTGKEISVEEAYNDIAGMLIPETKHSDSLFSRAGKAFMGGAYAVPRTMYNFLAVLGTGMQSMNRAELLARGIEPDAYLRKPEEVGEKIQDAYARTFEEWEVWYRDGAKLPEDWATNSESFGNWCGNLFVALSGYIPELAAQISIGRHGGMGALGGIYFINKSEDLRQSNPEMTDQTRMLNAAGTALLNAAGEKITLGILDGKITRKWAKEGIKAGWRKVFGYFGYSAGKEGAEEALEQLAENTLDIYTGVRGDYKKFSPDDWNRNLFSGVSESGILGAVTGGALSVRPYADYRRLDQKRNEAVNALEGEKQRLLAVENPTEQETEDLKNINQILEAGDYRQISETAGQIALRNTMEKSRNMQETVDADAERTIDDDAEIAKQNYLLRMNQLAHNPQDTAEALFEMAKIFRNIRIEAADGPAAFSPEALAEAKRRNADPEFIRAWYVESDNAVWVNTRRVRPSEVPFLMLHEIATHKGLPEVLGKNYGPVMDSIFQQYREYIEEVNQIYHFDLDTVDGRRMATEEYLADRAEFCGHDWRAYEQEHREDVDRYILEHGLSRESRKNAVHALMEADGLLNLRPSWWREFLQKIKMFLRSWKGFEEYRFSDREIETLLLRGLRKTGNKPVINFYSNRRNGNWAHQASSGSVIDSGIETAQNPETVRSGTDADSQDGDLRFAMDQNGTPMFYVSGKGLMNAQSILEDKTIPEDTLILTDSQRENWGHISEDMIRNAPPDLALKSLPIRLYKGNGAYGLVHLFKHLKDFGRTDLSHLIENVFGKPNKIYARKDGDKIKLEVFPKPPDQWGILELREEKNCYSVISFYPRQNSHSKAKGKLIWEYGSHSVSSQAASELPNPGISEKTPQDIRAELATKSYTIINPFGIKSSAITEKKHNTSRTDAGPQGAPEPIGYSLETATASKAGYRVERVNENAGREFNEAKGVIVQPEQIYRHGEVPKEQPRTWLRKRCVEYAQTNHILGEHETPALGNGVKVTVGSVKAVLNHPGSDIKNNLIAVIPEMLKNAVLIQVENNGRNKAYLLASKVRYGENDRFIVGMIIHESQGKFYYDHELVEIENADIQNGLPLSTLGTGSESASVITVIQNALFASGFDKKDAKNIKFSLEQYSDAERGDIVTFLKPYVGRAMERSDADYLKHLRKNGFNVASEEDAHVFASEAQNANERDARIQGAKSRDEWLIQNNYWFGKLFEITGKTDFVIRPSNKFIGEEFTGSFISPEFVKYSADTKKRNRAKKLKEATGYHSDELARMIADKDGGDELQIEQEMIDYFRHKKKVVRNKDERRNGNLGLYDEYSEWKASSPLLNARLDEKLKAEWEAEKAARIEDEIIEILTNGTEITEAFVRDNRDVYNELYQRFMKKKAPYSPAKRDLDAINAALRQEGSDAASYARGWKEGRIAMKQKEFREFVQTVLDRNINALKLQREAVAFAEKHLKPEDRNLFIRKILSLLEYDTRSRKSYPEGRRKAELEKLFSEILEVGEKRRRVELLDKLRKRLDQLGSRVDGSRKVKGIRGIETQAKLDRIIALSRMSPEMVEGEITAAQTKIEQRLENGESTVDLEYEIACAELYGNLENKDLKQLEEAYRKLEELAKYGKNEILTAIEKRGAEDEQIINECETILRGGHKQLSWNERRTLEKKRERRTKLMKAISDNFWESFNLWGLFDICALASEGDARKTPFYRFAQITHIAAREKDSRNRKHAERTAGEIDSIWKTKSSRERADVIAKLRERIGKTGVFRDVPDPDSKHFEYDILSVEEARKALNDGSLNDYEEAAVRHQLEGIGKKVKYESDEFHDDVTNKLLKLIRAENETGGEVRILIPRIRNSGTKTELALTQMEALYLHLLWQQKNIRYKLHFNGYSEETMRQIDVFLRPETKEFGAWMVKQLENDHADIDKVYRKLYFAAFPREEAYFPSVYETTRNSINADGIDLSKEGEGGKPSTYSPGELKIRVFHLKEPKIADALTVFENHRLRMTHFVTHAESARRLRAVFLNPRIRTALTDEHGEAMYANLKDSIRDYINGGNVDVKNNILFHHLHSNFVRSKMIYNLTSGMKQTLGGISYAMDIPPGALAKGIADFWTHPGECIRILSGSDYFQNRWLSGSNADLRMLLDATGRNSSGYAVFMEKLDTLASLPLRFGDAASVVMGGWAVYKYHFDNLLKNGVNRTEAHKAALLEWEMSTERTQQSSQIHMLNKAQRGGGVNRLFTTFLSNQILLYQNYAARFYTARHFNRTSLYTRGAKTMAVGLVVSMAMTAFDQMFRHGVKFDNWEWLDFFFASFGDYLVAVPWIGPIITQASKTAANGYGSNMPVVDDISRSIKSGWKVSEEEVEFDEDCMKDVVNILQGLGYVSAPASHAGALGRETRKWWNLINKEEK